MYSKAVVLGSSKIKPTSNAAVKVGTFLTRFASICMENPWSKFLEMYFSGFADVSVLFETHTFSNRSYKTVNRVCVKRCQIYLLG